MKKTIETKEVLATIAVAQQATKPAIRNGRKWNCRY